MAALQAAYPQDDEAAIFHALTLAITAPKTDKSFTNQRKCGEILEPIFARQHIILELPTASFIAMTTRCWRKRPRRSRLYAKIAPASAHANHMPSHLFTE
jgi:hypothetical protein